MNQLFVTGMLRSGTSLIQTLLTNHPQLFVAHQPFFQFYLDVRHCFLEEHGLTRMLPLGDGMDGDEEERNLFRQWLDRRRFDLAETNRLVSRAATGKGGGAKELIEKMTASQGTFYDIQIQLLALLAEHFGRAACRFIGAKEVLCEEYIPALVDASVRCLLIIRDPRAVIASASHGRYLESVGDRYPLLMLIRLWRKSAAYWLAFSKNNLAHTIRYEDLVQRPDDVLREIAGWLGIQDFPDDLIRRPLLDHTGAIWKGNSSFGDKIGVDRLAHETWRTLLTRREVRFIEACTKPELATLGYSFCDDLEPTDISEFVEDVGGVREAYLSRYRVDSDNRAMELRRWSMAECGDYDDAGGRKLFLFHDVF